MTSPPRYLALLDQLRGLAAASVVVAHLVGGFLADHGRDWPPMTLLRRFALDPLVIVQDMGWLGVAVFFLISGYVVTQARQRERAWAFGVRRILRIYPPLIATILLVLAITPAPTPAGLSVVSAGAGVEDWLVAGTLANYVLPGFTPIVGVAWTLAVEVVFYALVAAIGWLRGRAVWLMPVLILVVCAAAVLTARSFGDVYFLVAANLSYVPLLVLGQLTFLWHRGQVRAWVAIALGVAAWVVFVLGLEGIQPIFLDPPTSYGPSLLLAGALFAGAIALEGRLRSRRALRVLAARSYSLYLVHGPVGLTVLWMVVLELGLPYELGLALALAAVAAATELVHRAAEVPGIAIGRRITRSAPSVRGTAVAASTDASAPAAT
ncbi:acyltransferase family protein [Agrococcus jejuensis]|uniref:Peptidoglycan/LPS O-acetylase OafA/YrhL, contains acyltransferase and SGNH-hydrolase domains n=1 Tax=Agrococcus jejuensis TaxID=399736 RepID=A0A1G8FA31_9MICO|nr:acyltransferase [Agrococcus jejuensis]SDH78829.1 Peptidoglycan/LPS O-acetylase OafA/YrhL, contains acyltransferase and SGNH-hydrolase domains [Agrococcus jejuensis]